MLARLFMLDALRALFSYRNLILQLVKRDIASRYQGAFLGIAWSLVFPLLTLAVYGFVFGVVLQPRWPSVEGPIQFTLILFSGLLIFNFFSECLARAPLLLVSNANFVKKVVFPIEILIWVPIATALFHLGLGLLAWFVLNLVVGASISWSFLLFPFALAPLILLVAGLTWFLCALGVFVRDVAQVIGVSMQLLLYLGPIIYPREILPEGLRWLMLLNPLTIPVEQFRNVVNFGMVLDWQAT
ncbi:MAG: ABC transporter permease, partial [Candidatus Moraniibacteriota bacterium]